MTSRLKDLIIIRGRNYFPQDIEQSIENLYDAKSPGWCVAFAIDNDNSEQLVILAEYDAKTLPLAPTALLQLIHITVSQQHQITPDCIQLVPKRSLPKTTSGKIQRVRCRQLYLSQQIKPLASFDTASAAIAKPPVNTTSVTQQIINTVAVFLKTTPEAIDPDKAITDYGLSSVKLMTLTTQLETQFNCCLEANTLFNYPTITQLAEYLSSQTITSAEATE